MRRCPHEDQQEHQHGFKADPACRHRPADHRRESTRRPADHDVLRGPALEPHRVNDGIEEDGEGQQPRRDQIGRQRQHHDGKTRQRHAHGQRLAGFDLAGRNRPLGGALHHRVDIRIPPHVQRARGPCPHRDEQDRSEADHRMHADRSGQKTHQRREHDQRHHARLEQRDVIAKARLGLDRLGVDACVGHVWPLSGRSCRRGTARAPQVIRRQERPACGHVTAYSAASCET